MKINFPAFISSRLCAAVKIGSVTISIEYAERGGDSGRTRFQYYLDMAECGKAEEYHSDDLQSGCQGGTLQEGLGSLLSFLGHAGESYGYAMRTDRKDTEGLDLFPEWVNEWAYQYDDELSMLQYDMEEGDIVLIDEN